MLFRNFEVTTIYGTEKYEDYRIIYSQHQL